MVFDGACEIRAGTVMDAVISVRPSGAQTAQRSFARLHWRGR